MSAIYNGRAVTVITTLKGHALVMSEHNPRPSWVPLRFIVWKGVQANGKLGHA